MKKLAILGATLALCVVTAPALVTSAQAAPAKSPYCDMKFKKWSTNWQEYYHCFGTPQPQLTRTVHRQNGPAKSPYCNMKFKKWSTNWQEYYHCFGS